MKTDKYAKSLAEYAHARNLHFVPIAYCPLKTCELLLLHFMENVYTVFAIENHFYTVETIKNLPKVRLVEIHQEQDWLALLEFRDYCKMLGAYRAMYSVVSASEEEIKKELEKLDVKDGKE